MKWGEIFVEPSRLKRRNRIAAGAMIIACVIGLASTSHAQKGSRFETRRLFIENATLPANSNLLKSFDTIKELLEDKRWAEAIDSLQKISQAESKSLALVQPGKPGETATYLNAATRCNVLLSRIAQEGRVVYRQKIDPQAKRWFENWQRTGDEAELLRIVQQAYLSSYTDEALFALGELAWDRGDFSMAQSWWEQLVPLFNAVNPSSYPTVLRYPDSNIGPATIHARIVLCSIMRGEIVRAEDELLQFAERYPVEEGRLGGQSGRYVDLLRKILVESREWKRSSSAAEVATFGMSAQRCQTIPESIDVGALRWTRALSPSLLQNLNDCLSYHPVVYDTPSEKIVIVNDADAIRAWNILSGEPAWKSENSDPAVIYPAIPDQLIRAPKQRFVGVPHYTMTISEDRLYARMGSPVTCSSNVEMSLDQPSELVCLDLKQEGKLIWKESVADLFPGLPSWRFEGTPVIFRDRAYVALCRRHPQLELMIACLDADDGRLLWQCPVGAFRASVDDSVNRISHLLLTVGGNHIFLSTDLGVIVAVDTRQGRLDWAISYESRNDIVNAPGQASRSGLVPALYHSGMLFVAPVDAGSAFCIEADSGRLMWQFPFLRNMRTGLDLEMGMLKERQWKHLLGVVPGGIAGRLIVSGNSVWSIDIQTGQIVWTTGDLALKRESKGPFGRGLIAGDQALIPLRESIEFFNLDSGELVRRVPLKTPDVAQQGGNLTLAGGMLLVAQPGRLVAYGEYSRLKERLEENLTSHPNPASLRIQLAELEAAEGRIDAAIDQFRELLPQLDAGSSIFLRVRQKFAKLLRESASEESGRQNYTVASERWREALTITDDAPSRVAILFDLARVEELQGNPAAAVAHLQRILLADNLARASFESTPWGKQASEMISRLIADVGRDVYRDIETSAAAEFEALARTEDKSGLRQLILHYPHAQAAAKARKMLVQLHRSAGEFSEALALLSELRGQAEDEQSLAQVTLSMLELMRQAGYSNSMKPLWRSLANLRTAMQVSYEGKSNQDLYWLVQTQLREINERTRVVPRQLERTWTRDLPANSRVIIPAGQSVSPELTCAMACFKLDSPRDEWQWRCIDWITGQTRWEVVATDPIDIVEWAPAQLVIGTAHGWQARAPEHGRVVWGQQLADRVTPRVFRETSNIGIEVLWLTTFDTVHGARIFDSGSGQLINQIKPAGALAGFFGFGRLSVPAHRVEGHTDGKSNRSERVKSDGEAEEEISLFAVAMQTVKPTQIWVATASSPREIWSLEEVHDESETWIESPVMLNNRLIGLSYGNTLTGYQTNVLRQGSGTTSQTETSDLLQSSNPWSYRNFSAAHASPALVQSDRDLLLVVDGMRLASFDPATGSRKWVAGLTNMPMKNAAARIAVDQNSVFATANGVLRAISIKGGYVQYERYLGNVAEQWRTTVAWVDQSERPVGQKNLYELTPPSSIIAAWSDSSDDGQHYAISLCDGQSGTILQQLRMVGEPRGIMLDASGRGILWTDRAVVGLRFSAAPSATKSRE